MSKPLLLQQCLCVACLAVCYAGVELMTKSNLPFTVAF